MTRNEKRHIKKVAAEHFDGDLQLASAAHVHSFGVVKKVGSKMVDWFDHEKIAAVQKEVEAPDAPAKKAPAKKAPAKKAPAKKDEK